MTATSLKAKLQQPYTPENWLSIAKEVFGKLSVLSKPIDIGYNKDFVKSFRQLGHVHLDDGKSLAMIEVKVDDTKDLYRNKVELRALTTRLIDEDTSHGVLVIYDNESGNYRFTFAAKETVLNETTAQVETKETHPKRFTYLLGPGESCFTPAIQLSKLADKGQTAKLTDVVEAFNVEAVNKKFFNEYKGHYTAFVEHLNKKKYKTSVFNGDEKAVRDFVKKMLGRIVFLYFLQKKGWLGVPIREKRWEGGDPNFLKNLFEFAGKGESFYSYWLVKLFETLNDENKKEIFQLPNGTKVKIPFLNGGLFENDNLDTTYLMIGPELFDSLFVFLDQYNFTIYEDDPEERFLAVDPEMLGHIFENLLEENENKKGGIYYTPKEIVHYMCQESLIEYLYADLTSNGTGVERVALEKLVKQKSAKDISDYDEAILKALRNVKICDPAIGSGAFPMGLLHEIFDLVQLVHDLNPDVTEDVWQLTAGWNPAKVKENIIQNSIYGVDIEKGAVEIARLRFWLSLVVDEEVPKPLPNLDYKIMQGNSLLGIPKNTVFNVAEVEKLEALKAQYFSGRHSGRKERLKAEIEKTTQIILDTANDYSAYPINFDFKLFFSEVFHGEKKGFDIVIGNPPYVRQEELKDLKPYLKELYRVYAGTADLLVYFFEVGLNVLKNGGLLMMITSNKWMQAGYGKPLRGLLAENDLKQVIDFGDSQLFESATTYTCITLVAKQKSSGKLLTGLIRETTKDKGFDEILQARLSIVSSTSFGAEPWFIQTGSTSELLNKVVSKFPKLEKYLNGEAKRGIVTGFTEAFLVNDEDRRSYIKEHPASKKILKPLVRGRSIQRWHTEKDTVALIGTFPALGLKIDDYPPIKQHLLSYGKKRLEQSGNAGSRKKTSYKWFETQDGIQYWKEFEKSKIMYQVFQVKPCFIYDDTGMYCNNSMWIIPKDDKALLGILNSKMGWWLISKFCTPIQNGYQLIWKYFGQIPIAPTNNKLGRLIEKEVEKILALKKADKNADVQKLERKIDFLVYKLYKLNFSEASLIEGNQEWMTQEAYESVTPEKETEPA